MSRQGDRQRSYRHRVSAGKIILQIEVNELDTVEALITAGFLDADDADDRQRIGYALERMIAALVAGG